MTVLRVCRTTMGDEERGDIVFAGALVIFPGVAGLDAFRARVDELIRAAFGVADPETAQFTLTQADYQDTVRALQERVRKDATVRRLLLSALENTGLAVSDTYWDWIHLRVLPHGAEHAAAGTGWHRDTWASNLAAQTNWWTPIYPVTAGRTITFAPAQWSQPLANTSHDWDPHTARAQRQAPEPSRRVPMIPELVDPLSAVPELRVVVEPGDLLCFSGSHLHGSVANESGRARFSVEVRTVHRADVDQGRGAANVDGHAPQVQYRWFHHVVDGTPLG